MANVFVGFHDRKSCSRILKPPGGGTSDIFNTSLEEKTPTKTDGKPVTSPSKEQIVTENVTKVETNGAEHKDNNEIIESRQIETSKEENPEIQPDDVKIASLTISETINEETKEIEGDNEIQATTTEMKTAKSTTETLSSIVHQSQHSEVKSSVTEKRTSHRVPPGGYSSGLW